MKSTWFKALFMSLSLALVVGLIYKLKSAENFGDSLGLILYGTSSENSVDWCHTRVDEIEVPGKFRVFQEGLKWYREDFSKNQVAELGFIPVEKWFSNHCRLEAQGKTEGLAAELGGPDEKTLARIGFIKGPDVPFKEITEGVFTWDEVTFRSNQLKAALEELRGLPTVGGTEKPKSP